MSKNKLSTNGGKFGTLPCVLCGIHDSTRTGDHLPPQCIYPPPRTPNMELHKVPACESCNNLAARHDEGFKVVLNFLTGEFRDKPDDVISSLAKTIGHNDKIAHQIFSTRRRVYADRGSGILEPVTEVSFPMESYNSVIERIVRGLFWCETNKIMPQDAEVTVRQLSHFNRTVAEDMRDLLSTVQPRFLNDKTVVYRAFFWDDGCSFWGIQFFDKHIVFAGATAGQTDGNANSPQESVG